MNQPDHDHGLICAYVLNGQGGATRVRWPELRDGRAPAGVLWVHLDSEEPQAQSWLQRDSGLPPWAVEAMLADSTRPRVEQFDDGVLMILRGVNLNPGSEPEDMVALRIWGEHDRLITMRHRKLMAVQDVRDAIEAGRGPADTGDLLLALAGRLLHRMGTALDQLEDDIDALEQVSLANASSEHRSQLAAMRRQTILLRRHIAPQRDAMARLQSLSVDWLVPEDRLLARELHDRVTRYVEDLDSARDRAQVVQEEVAQRLAEQTNRTIYVLSIVAAIFLPLSLLTGLLGVNVDGIPGAHARGAFAAVAGLLLVVALLEAWIFRRAHWL